mmetsp:Transcript_22800/g.48451  ORF Transcript_22800/g.48451 Transcript_22800/m.48451 type:complete len:354 (-) Transcript_22800:68-1129(-)
MDPPAVIQVPAKLVIGGRFREGCVRKQLVCLFDLRMQQQVTEHEIEKGSLRVDVPAKTGHVVRLGHDLSQRQDDGGVLHGIGDQGTVSVEASQEGIERGDRSAETGGNLPGGHRDVFQEDGNAGFDQGHRLRVFFFLPQYADPEAQQPGLDLPAGGRREIAGILRRLALDVHGRRRRRRRCRCRCFEGGVPGIDGQQQGPGSVVPVAGIQQNRRRGNDLRRGCLAGRPRGRSEPPASDLHGVPVGVHRVVAAAVAVVAAVANAAAAAAAAPPEEALEAACGRLEGRGGRGRRFPRWLGIGLLFCRGRRVFHFRIFHHAVGSLFVVRCSLLCNSVDNHRNGKIRDAIFHSIGSR